MDRADFAHTRQRLLTCEIYHHILSSHSEMSFCQIGVLMQGDLSCLIFERLPAIKAQTMLKDIVSYSAHAEETRIFVLVFRSTNSCLKRKVYPHFRLKFLLHVV